MTLILHTSSDPSRTNRRKATTPPPTLSEAREAFHRLVTLSEFAAHLTIQPRKLDRDEAVSLVAACKQVGTKSNIFRRAALACAKTQYGSRFRSNWKGLDLLVGAGQAGQYDDRRKKRHLRVENASTARLCWWAQGKRTSV
jgi:hypothetical protein